jgi:hypothetical protein
LTGLVALAAAHGAYAARIHDNTVKQPIGQALRLFVLGPSTVAGNQFHVDANLPMPGMQTAEQLASALFVMAPGSARRGTHAAGPVPTLSRGIVSVVGGSALFSNNRTRVGIMTASLASQVVFLGGDIGFDGNYSEVLTPLPTMLWNTVLAAATVRASNNRFVEPRLERRLSLQTHAIQMNTTVNNQANNNVEPECEAGDEKIEKAGNLLL